MHKKPIIFLIDHGSSSSGVFDDLKQMGYYVLFAGKNQKLQEMSDEFIDINPVTETTDLLEKHGKYLNQLNVDAVYSFLEHAKISENKIATYLNKPTIPKEVLSLGRDKYLMRQNFTKRGGSSCEFYFIKDDVKDPIPPMDFPFIIKPNLGFASGGVQLVKDIDHFKSALKIIRRLNKFVLKTNHEGETGAICEQFIDGPEYSLDSITINGKTRAFCLCARSFPGENNFQDYGYYTPEDKNDEMLKDLEVLIGNALNGMNYTDGPSHAEVRYDTKNKRWQILEIGLRVGLAGLVGRLINEITNINYNQIAIKASQRLISYDDLLKIPRLKNRYGILFVPETGIGGKIKYIGGVDFLKSDSRVKHFGFEKNIGDTVTAYPKSLDYLGVVIGTTNSFSELEEFNHELSSKVVFEYE
jgi:D-alanine-D-alanine ligase-like ATP-grasp enzyme